MFATLSPNVSLLHLQHFKAMTFDTEKQIHKLLQNFSQQRQTA
jgi:hypothetical protein